MKIILLIVALLSSNCFSNAFSPALRGLSHSSHRSSQLSSIGDVNGRSYSMRIAATPVKLHNGLEMDSETSRIRNTQDGRKIKWIVGGLALMISVLGFTQPSLANIAADFETIKMQASDSGFLQAFLLIFISEIGDKTFFIAGLLAAKYGRFISFTGSIGALAVMTIISTVLGQIFHAIPESLTQGIPFDDIVAVAAFSYFGLKTLLDASKLEAGDNSGIEEEKAEAEEVVDELTQDEKRKSIIAKILQTFTLVFAAEIGDRSFLSTIALSAALNPYAVASGAIAAHASATGVAVAGGVLLSKYLSEKVIGYIGGSLFLVFAVTTALGIF